MRSKGSRIVTGKEGKVLQHTVMSYIFIPNKYMPFTATHVLVHKYVTSASQSKDPGRQQNSELQLSYLPQIYIQPKAL